MLATETVAIAATTGSPRVLATSKGPTMSGKQEEAEKPKKPKKHGIIARNGKKSS